MKTMQKTKTAQGQAGGLVLTFEIDGETKLRGRIIGPGGRIVKNICDTCVGVQVIRVQVRKRRKRGCGCLNIVMLTLS